MRHGFVFSDTKAPPPTPVIEVKKEELPTEIVDALDDRPDNQEVTEPTTDS